MLSYRVAQYNNDYQVKRRQREWEEADEEERRQVDERMRADREQNARCCAMRARELIWIDVESWPAVLAAYEMFRATHGVHERFTM